LRETLEGLLKRARTDERRADLEDQLAVPPLPPALAYLWQAFLRLASRRQSSGFGPMKLGWSEIEAFNRLSGLALRPWEIEVIEALDDRWMAAQATSKEVEQS
jgi:hypothetical protein